MVFFFFQAEDGIRDLTVTGVQTCALPISPKGSSIDSDWSTKNKKQPGFLRLISAWYAMVCLHFFWHHENCDSHVPAVTGWSPVATIPRMQRRPSLLRQSQGRIAHGTLTA